MQVVGAIPEHVARQLGLSTSARTVFLHERTVAAIGAAHERVPRDAEMVFEHMPAPICRPMFCGLEARGDVLRVGLAEFVSAERRYLYVTLTLVRARGGADELWVSAAHPMSEATLRRYLRRGRLQGVVGGSLEGGKTRTARRASTPVRLATQMP